MIIMKKISQILCSSYLNHNWSCIKYIFSHEKGWMCRLIQNSGWKPFYLVTRGLFWITCLLQKFLLQTSVVLFSFDPCLNPNILLKTFPYFTLELLIKTCKLTEVHFLLVYIHTSDGVVSKLTGIFISILHLLNLLRPSPPYDNNGDTSTCDSSLRFSSVV